MAEDLPSGPEATEAELTAKGVNLGRCDACGADAWGINSDLYALVAIKATGSTDALPLHTVVCGRCGNVRLFHAYVLATPPD